MKVRAQEREFSVWQLFCHDSPVAEVVPFDQYRVAEALNKWADALYPNAHIRFVSPADSGMSRWHVEFNESRWDYAPSGKTAFVSYPKVRTYSESQVRRAMPKALREVLEKMDVLDELEL